MNIFQTPLVIIVSHHFSDEPLSTSLHCDGIDKEKLIKDIQDFESHTARFRTELSALDEQFKKDLARCMDKWGKYADRKSTDYSKRTIEKWKYTFSHFFLLSSHSIHKEIHS